MEVELRPKVEFVMDTDWLIQDPIDFEHKKYVLLGYFKKIDQLLNQDKIYPTFIELSLHLASLQTLVNENVILYTNKELKSYDDEILIKDLLVRKIPKLNHAELSEINDIVKYATTKFIEYFNAVKAHWGHIYENITISPKRNKKNVGSAIGYMTYHSKKDDLVYVWEYSITNISLDIGECSVELKLICCDTKDSLTFSEIIQSLSTFTRKDRKHLPVFEAKTTNRYPMNETLIPLFKRRLMSYVLQTTRVEDFKE